MIWRREKELKSNLKKCAQDLTPGLGTVLLRPSVILKYFVQDAVHYFWEVQFHSYGCDWVLRGSSGRVEAQG